MMETLLVIAVFVAACSWVITVLVGRWALREQQADARRVRARLDRIMQANEPPAASGFNRRRVG